MMNKPGGCITARSDASQRTVMEYFPEELARELFPVGRLDKDTEGLLLITNDGELSHQLLSPKKHVDKTYIADVKNFDDYDKVISDFTDYTGRKDLYKKNVL